MHVNQKCEYMHMPMYICTYLCLCVRMYVLMCEVGQVFLYMLICVYVDVPMYGCGCVCMCVCTYVCLYAFMHFCGFVFIFFTLIVGRPPFARLLRPYMRSWSRGTLTHRHQMGSRERHKQHRQFP